ncbi:MAG: hypothetical protein WD651_02490 [Acidimicrobiia bacterium]
MNAVTLGTRMLVLVLLPALVSCGDGGTVGNPQTTAVNWHPQMEQSGRSGLVEGAVAELVRYPEGISFQLTTEGLTPGNAYTLWLVVINSPEACESNPCTPPEALQLSETDSQVLFAGGEIAGGSRGTFAGSAEVGSLEGWLPDRSLVDSLAAEVWLVVNDHGPALDEFMPGMINSYRGGCSDDSPFPPIFPDTALGDGESGPNTCLLYQVAIFLVP